MMRLSRALCWLCLPLVCVATAWGDDEPTVDFDKQIRPLLAKHCLECHGAETQEAGLRLDLKSTALTGGDSGEVVQAGNSGESLLYKYVSGVDPDIIMPPDGKLADESVALLKAWIDQGAVWPDDPESRLQTRSDHWSFQPIAMPTVPAVPDDLRRLVRNPIDQFILARLADEKIAPSPEADRATLIRRLSLDLLGLLPTAEEVGAFIRDDSPDAYENLVDRLLASPHFGERWGRHWLDLARYADSDGYEKDTARPFAWRWRDWVIESINRDQPFDQFTIEQLAGDMLPEATLEQKIATGFHRNTLTNREGGVDQEEYRVKATVDRINTTGSIWLGLTVGCAQCHSHKYDPLTQREYFQLYAFFNSVDEVDLPAPTEDDRRRYEMALARHQSKLAELEQQLAAYRTGEFEQRFARWQAETRPANVEWTTLSPTNVKSAKGVEFTVQEDGSYLVEGANPDKATYEVSIPLSDSLSAIRLDVFPDDRLPSKGPGRVAHGNFVLSRFRTYLTEPDQKERELKLARADATYVQSAGTTEAFEPSLALIDGDPKRGWAVGSRYGEGHSALFELGAPIHPAAGSTLRIVMDQNYGAQHTIGRFRLAATVATAPVTLRETPSEIVRLLERPADQRTSAETEQLRAHYAQLDAGLAKRQRAIDTQRGKSPELTTQRAQTLAERNSPRDTHVMLRGDFLSQGARVTAATPAVLTPVASVAESPAGPSRLDFARWLVSEENPLTRRVTVNRVWQNLFGDGLVRTPEDFGTRGESPSHPELLDWLAIEFSNRGWSRKGLIRLIVTSHTYRQSSQTREDLVEQDPLNRLLAQQNRFRLEAEIVRDLFLDASGLLTEAIGGPSVHPPLPSGVRELGYANSVKWPESTGFAKYRRGCYIFFQRTVPYPMLMTFDSPDSNVSCARRERSNTPLQSLTLLNDPTFFECCQALGRSLAAMSAGDDARLDRLMQVSFGRSPTSREAEILTGLLEDYRRLAADAGAEAEERAWVGVTRVVLNLDEFVTRE